MAKNRSKMKGVKSVSHAHKKHAQKQAMKTDRAWHHDMGKLQAAQQKLKKCPAGLIDLSQLPISRAITGAETHADQMKLVKATIKDSLWQFSHGAALAAKSYEVVQEEKRAATARLAKLKERQHRDAVAAAEKAGGGSTKTATTSFPQLSAQSNAPKDWTVVAPKNPRAAKKVAGLASVEVRKLQTAIEAQKRAQAAREEVPRLNAKKGREAVTPKPKQSQTGTSSKKRVFNESESTGWQNQFQQGFHIPMGNSWADDVQQSVDQTQSKKNSPAKTNKASAKTTQLSKAAEMIMNQQKPKKPNKKRKLGALAALAALAGERETVIEQEAQHEYVEVTRGALPAERTFCGDQLGINIAPLYEILSRHNKLQIEADREEQQRLAQENARARQKCIGKLSQFFPDKAEYAQITLIGQIRYPKASILGMPERVRQKIFRLALIEHEPIHITSSSHKQPALLRTCQQLRLEALWIFENFNTFCIEVVDCQPVVPKNYNSHWARQVLCKLETSGEPKWDNLKKWLKSYHEDGVPGLRDQGHGKAMAWDVCGQAFELVLSLRAIFPEMTFEEMEPMLEVWKKTVSLQQVDWTWE